MKKCDCGEIAFCCIDDKWLCHNCIKKSRIGDNFDWNTFFTDAMKGKKF